MICSDLSPYTILDIANNAIILANEAEPEKPPTSLFEAKEYTRDILVTGLDAVDYVCQLKMPNGLIVKQVHSITGGSQIHSEGQIKASLLANCLAAALYESNKPA